jgi:hypothetical protein
MEDADIVELAHSIGVYFLKSSKERIIIIKDRVNGYLFLFIKN